MPIGFEQRGVCIVPYLLLLSKTWTITFFSCVIRRAKCWTLPPFKNSWIRVYVVIISWSTDNVILLVCLKFTLNFILLIIIRILIELEIKDTTESSTSASYLDVLLNIDVGGKLTTQLYDKRDDFDFAIVNFPYICSNIPLSPVYGVYLSQLIRYARACSTYDQFLSRGRLLTDKLMLQGFLQSRLMSAFRKFYGRYVP